MIEALVIVHLGSLDSYAEFVDDQQAQQLAQRMISAVRKHRGPVYIVDQFWADGPLRDQVKAAIAGIPAQWIKFDEDVQRWSAFLPALKRRLTRDHVQSVVIGGIWFDPNLKTGCATEVYLYLLRTLPVRVDKQIVGCETD